MAYTHRGSLELTDTGIGSGLQLKNTNTTDPTVDGQITYVDGVGFRGMAETSVITLGAAGGGAVGTWDEIYSADKTLTVSSTSMIFAGTADVDVVTINGNADVDSGALLQLNSSGDAKDIQGTSDTWNVSQDGYVTAVRALISGYISTGSATDLVLHTNNSTNSSSMTITDAANGDITFAMNGTGMVVISGTTETNPALTVSNGDVVVSDGSFTLTDDDAATAVSITHTGNANTLTIVADSTTASNIVDINGDAMTSGSVIHLDVTGATFTGEYLDCTDGGTSEFKVMRYGATTIKGNAAGTDAFTITAGDLLLDDSDQNIIESEDGTSTLLLLDNKAGAVGSGAAVLKVDAGGVVNAAGYGILATFTGAAAAGATVIGVVPDAGSIGVKINAGGLVTKEALWIDADPTANDVVLIHTDAVIAADKGLLQLTSSAAIASGGTMMRFDVTGAPNANARLLEFDVAGITDTNEPYVIYIDSGGKKSRALHIDADPVTNDVAYIHTDGATANNKAVLSLSSAGEPAHAGANVLRVAFTGTATNTPTLVEVLGSGKDVRALYIDADPTALDAVHINCDSVIAADKGALQIVTTGAIAAGGTAMRFDVTGTLDADARVLEFDLAAVTDTNEPYAIYVDGAGKKIRALYIDADPVTNDLCYIHSDAAIADNKALVNIHQATGAIKGGASLLRLECDSAPLASFALLEVEMTGITATNDPAGIFINGVAKDVTAMLIDVDNTDINAVSIDGSGALDGGRMLLVDNDNTPAANTDAVAEITFTGTATNNPIVLSVNNSTKDALPLLVTSNVAAATRSPVTIVQDSTTGAMTCLELDQDDADKGFITFDGTEASGGSINTDDKSGGTAKYAMVDVNGSTYYIKLTPGA